LNGKAKIAKKDIRVRKQEKLSNAKVEKQTSKANIENGRKWFAIKEEKKKDLFEEEFY
jgi:hypothetical protein